MSSRDLQSPAWENDVRRRLEELIDEYRVTLHDCLDGLTEDEVRLHLVPSKTTLLGLVKHLTFVEGVWFDQAITGRTYQEVGIASTPAQSFLLRKSDTIASVQATYRDRCDASRRALGTLESDAVVEGRGERPVWTLLVQVLRELAHHAGHADILREQTLARRTNR